MSTSRDEANARIIEEFRANDGRVGGGFEGMQLLLLHHTGAKSGTRRINPVAYLADDGRYVVFASRGGAPANPAWYHNLMAHPGPTIAVGMGTNDVVTSEATSEERARLYCAHAVRIPQSAADQK